MDNSIKDYFSNAWLKRDRSIDKYTYTGWALLDKVKPHEFVIDIGCGTNPFKGKIQHLIGIDVTDVGSDIQVSIDDYHPAILFDVAFCLGSINFGTEEEVYNQIKKIDSILTKKGRIYWRCNPGRYDHGNEEFSNLTIFPWTEELHRKWSKEFGYELVALEKDCNRIYAEWQK